MDEKAIKKAKDKNDDMIQNIKTLSTLKKRILSTVPVYILALQTAGTQIVSLAITDSLNLNYYWKISLWSVYLFFIAIAAWVEKTHEIVKMNPELKFYQSFFKSFTAPIMILIYTFGVFDEPLRTYISVLNLDSGTIKAIQFIIILVGYVIMGFYNLLREMIVNNRVKKLQQNTTLSAEEKQEKIANLKEEINLDILETAPK